MPKSNRGGFGPRFRHGHRHRGTGPPVLHRNAKIVFYVIWIVVGAAGRHRAGQHMAPHPRPARGLVIGLAAALIVAAVVLAWPVLRAIWWWTPEIALAVGLVLGWVELADHTTLLYRLGAVVLIVGVPAAIPPVRRAVIALGLVPGHPAPRPDLLLRIHHHQPHRQPAADLVGTPHPGRGTGLDLAAARPGPGRPAGPARPDRRRLLGRPPPSPRPPPESNAALVRLDIKRRERPHRTVRSRRCWT